MEDCHKEKMEEGGQNVDLPQEMIEAILSRLPVKPLCRFKLVSKSWQSLISDPVFITNYSKAAIDNEDFFSRRRIFFTTTIGSQFMLYSLNLDQFLNENGHNNVDDLVEAAPIELNSISVHNGAVDYRVDFVHCSCYGLFLCEVPGRRLSLVNPATKESKTLPNAPSSSYSRRNLYGLGFDHSTNEYKVIDGEHHNDERIVFSVYTLQTDSWRQIDYLFPYYGLFQDKGFLLNGGVHWLVSKVADGAFVIISFLLAEERVREIALPPNAPAEAFCIELGAYRNSLCATFIRRRTRKNNEFWVMKEYGVRESWTQMQVTKPYKSGFSHSGFSTKSHDLMVVDQSSFVMYNFNDGTFWDLYIPYIDIHDYISSFGIYVESLPLALMVENNAEGVKTIDAEGAKIINAEGAKIEDDRIHPVTSSKNYSRCCSITSAIVMLGCTMLVMLHFKAFGFDLLQSPLFRLSDT